uniref:RNA-directed DNA polymerase, eukaryota n=1 Tax=Tanacetum cinerariifolium TaxID=118510 RepID=A0A6L2LQH3_TANCI|nr:hypothetical protein [Tanacetum cinerariifolium]
MKFNRFGNRSKGSMVGKIARKYQTWEQLAGFTRIWHGLLCMMGDFNSSLDSNERLRSNVDTWAMDSIELLLKSSILVDIPPIIQGSHGLESRKKQSRNDCILSFSLPADFVLFPSALKWGSREQEELKVLPPSSKGRDLSIQEAWEAIKDSDVIKNKVQMVARLVLSRKCGCEKNRSSSNTD